MNILFTGASSFTGYWFIRELARSGHSVFALFRRPPASYLGVRRRRVEKLLPFCSPLFASFGDEAFLQAAKAFGPWDLLCHHAAETEGYTSPDFNAERAFLRNTHRARKVLQEVNAPLLLTGSVFEPEEGEGGDLHLPVSPYGLSKGLTARLFADLTKELEIPFGKFVIPNPFGPFEEPRFTSYLIREWMAGREPLVKTPRYIRDNIHVSLLAAAYRLFAEETAVAKREMRCSPSGYCESQAAFTARCAEEMGKRLSIRCPYRLAEQPDLMQPLIRINREPASGLVRAWKEERAWDALAEYYERERS